MSNSVLIIGNFLSAAGGSRGVCEELAERLSHVGWRVITASNKPAKLARLLDMIATGIRYRRQFASAHVEVFSGAAFFWAEATCWMLRRLNKSYVLTLHGGNLPAFARRWPRRVKWLLQSAAVVTAPSAYLKEAMEPYRPGIKVIPNPIRLELYPYRKRLTAAPRLVWLRAFHEIYNPLMAVQVVARLVKDFPEVHLTMVGPDKGDGSLQRVQAEVARLGLQRQVAFTGQVAKQEVPAVLARFDVFLNTTNFDNMPVSVIEALACGLCVVSTDAGGIPYLLEAGRTALLVKPGEDDAMAEAVKRIVFEPELARRLSEAGHKTVELCDWDCVLPKWLEILGGPVTA